MSAWTHTFHHNVPAPPARVFEALTDAQQLARWFAEHVTVELREGGDYRFWGRHSYGTARPEQATQRILRLVPGELLSYHWRFNDIGSEVTLALKPEAGHDGTPGTGIDVTQAFSTMPPGPRAKALVDDLWRLTLGNLSAHLKGEALALPDYADPRPVVRSSIVIDAPRAAVFRALTDPAKLNQWIAAAAEVEAHVGGAYRYGWKYKIDDRAVLGGPTRILEIVPDEKLVTDWPDWRGDPEVPTQTVTWLLESVGDKTRVTVVHSGFVRPTDVSDYPFGWGGFLESLKGLAEKPEVR